MEAKRRSFEEILIGETISFSRVFTKDDVEAFAKISGDYNPLHLDPEYAATTQFKYPIVHGMLLGSLCSLVVGMHIPGRQCLYLSQTLSFRNPAYLLDPVTVTASVISKSEATRIITLFISAKNKAGVCIFDGTATTCLLPQT